MTFPKGSNLYRRASLIARWLLIVFPWFLERRLRLLLILCSCVFGPLVKRSSLRFLYCWFHSCRFHTETFEIGDVYFHFGFALIAVSLFFRFSISSSFKLTFCCVFEWIPVGALACWCWIFVGFNLSNRCSNVGLSLAMFISLIFLEMFPYVLDVWLFPLTVGWLFLFDCFVLGRSRLIFQTVKLFEFSLMELTLGSGLIRFYGSFSTREFFFICYFYLLLLLLLLSFICYMYNMYVYI